MRRREPGTDSDQNGVGGYVITTRKDPHPGSDLMAVVGKIDGCPTNILIDTGSAVTLVQSGIPTEPWSNGNLLAADGTHLTVSGKRWAKLEIGNQAFTHPVVIVENLVQQALLGVSALRRFGCTLNIADAVLQINGESVRLIEATTARSPSVGRVPKETFILKVLVQRPEGRLPVAVARAVVYPREGCVPVQLLNPSGDRVTIHWGKVVATIEVVDPLPLARSPKTHVALPTAIEKLLDEVAQRTTSVRTDPSKTEKVASWPTPTSASEVRTFLGLASYYRLFVKSFASIARPLHRLPNKDVNSAEEEVSKEH
ncbi:Retrovirus-related Pol polyprotein from transposon gypsy [Trichinella pseudospiralis]|uniref:Retrovirus-related Pol polyprotein from transposon gypsy n=1 Tax=Trichinella pseudospiralis TaxID=6337 RepID=A0A0V1JJH9_TRIPS|nr:Retrovirus-related Pol polyprotein from transposon gypsy [Trichinella pseudospiralis]